jgi:hypothetical protein
MALQLEGQAQVSRLECPRRLQAQVKVELLRWSAVRVVLCSAWRSLVPVAPKSPRTIKSPKETTLLFFAWKRFLLLFISSGALASARGHVAATRCSPSRPPGCQAVVDGADGAALSTSAFIQREGCSCHQRCCANALTHTRAAAAEANLPLTRRR